MIVYLLCGVLGGAVLAAVVRPLFRADDTLESAILEETEWDLLQRKKEVVLGNIQDLDFEYQCGKLSEPDYRQVRAELAAEAAAILKQIDDIEASQDLDALIRREVSARRNRSRNSPGDVRNCPKCGHANTGSNKFCAECGSRLRTG